MIHFSVYPGGKKKAVTFSYDDGHINDVRLIALLNKYGMKGTFHLNSGRLGELTQENIAELRARYTGHEIACHTVNHGRASLMPSVSLVNEVLEDRKALEKIAGYPVVGMSYPYGLYNDETVTIMQSCGIVYSRTVNSTDWFSPLQDPMQWDPTCHHRNAAQCVDRFLTVDTWYGALLYIWGHSYEFREESQWAEFEAQLQRLANLTDVWYTTNIEIYNYVQAQKRLVVSADESMIYNPSSIPVWVRKDGETIEIAPNDTWAGGK